MPYIKTSELIKQLKENNITYEQYLKENADSFIIKDISGRWAENIARSGMKKNDIINKTYIGYTFFYDVINGRKMPSRDTVVKIFITLGLGLEPCQEMLKVYNWSDLYPKVKRDSILIYALTHKLSVYETIDLLADNNEAVL